MDAGLSPLLWLLFTIFGLQILLLLSPLIGSSSFVNGDVIGEYVLANEHQCDRLCGYRKPCSRYRYSSGGLSPAGASVGSNCILYVGSGEGTPVSFSSISEGCKKRPCGEAEVCVPMPSLPVPTSPNSVGYVCLKMPQQCGDPDPVLNANVTIKGKHPGDVADVVCREEFAFPSRSKVMQIKCLATSKWTAVESQCRRYEFRGSREEEDTSVYLFQVAEDQQTMCFQGVFTRDGMLYLNLQKETEPNGIHITFRYNFFRTTEFFWNRKEGLAYDGKNTLGAMPLTPGDRFNLSVHMGSGAMITLKLNQTLTYTIPLDDAQLGSQGFTVSNLKVIHIGGVVNLTYYNLLSLC